MVADDEALYLGTANPMNMLTDPCDDKPEGGWELRRLTRCASAYAGDIYGDDIVNFLDVAELGEDWQENGLALVGDIDGNGVVDEDDLAIIARDWLKEASLCQWGN